MPTLEDDGFVFRTAPSDILQAQALADVVERELGGADRTISLAARNDAYGEGFITRFKEAWEQRGGSTTGPVLYDPQQPTVWNTKEATVAQWDGDMLTVHDSTRWITARTG